MKKIVIPFNDWSERLIVAGKKTATTRYARYGEVHDYFYFDNSRWFLTEVYKTTLGFIAKNLYIEEGAKDEEEFIEIWKQIHPRRGFRPLDRVWFHRFERMT